MLRNWGGGGGPFKLEILPMANSGKALTAASSAVETSLSVVTTPCMPDELLAASPANCTPLRLTAGVGVAGG